MSGPAHRALSIVQRLGSPLFQLLGLQFSQHSNDQSGAELQECLRPELDGLAGGGAHGVVASEAGDRPTRRAIAGIASDTTPVSRGAGEVETYLWPSSLLK